MDTSIEFEVFGKNALFTDPMTKIGGENLTYSVPTYEAIKGICESIYWKPTIRWVVDEIRVLNPIRMETKSTIPMSLDGKKSLAYHTYLTDVRYQVKAHFIKNPDRPDLDHDYIPQKHLAIAKRAIKFGGRMDIFLGTKECQGYVEPCTFGISNGYYDEYGLQVFGVMVHGFDYPNKEKENLIVRHWIAKMDNGYIKFPKPQDCNLLHTVTGIENQLFDYLEGNNFKSVNDELLLYGKEVN